VSPRAIKRDRAGLDDDQNGTRVGVPSGAAPRNHGNICHYEVVVVLGVDLNVVVAHLGVHVKASGVAANRVSSATSMTGSLITTIKDRVSL
jgi:hypothetical protein